MQTQSLPPSLSDLAPTRRAFIRVMLYIYDKEKGSEIYLWPVRVARMYYMLFYPFTNMPKVVPPIMAYQFQYYLAQLAREFGFRVTSTSKRKFVVVVDLKKIRRLARDEFISVLMKVTEVGGSEGEE